MTEEVGQNLGSNEMVEVFRPGVVVAVRVAPEANKSGPFVDFFFLGRMVRELSADHAEFGVVWFGGEFGECFR